jgi:peptide/nickel transport system substrate-binding protein
MGYWDRAGVSRRRFIQGSGVAAASLAGAALIGCGDDDEPSSPGTPPAGGTTAPDVTGAIPPGTYHEELTPIQPVMGEGQRGGTLTLHFPGADPPELDPFTTSNVHNGWLSGFNNSGLLKWEDRNTYGELEIVNDMAESFETPDEETIVFKLRPGITWQDVEPLNGRPLTADDYKFTIERALEGGPDRALSAVYGAIQSVDAVDDVTIQINMTRDVAMLNKMAHHQAVPNAPEVVDQWDRHPPTLFGVGPYIMTEYLPGEHFKWVKNPNYWGPEPHLDEIEAVIQTDRGTRLANLRGGRVLLDEIAFSAMEPFQNSNPDHYIIRSPGNVHSGFGINHERVPDIRVRQAMSRATDVQGFIDIVWDGQGQRNPGTWWWQHPYALSPEEVEELAPYDPEDARALLAAAGAEGFSFTGVANAGHGTGAGTTTHHLEIWQDQLRQVGIEMGIDTRDAAAYNEQVYVHRDHDTYAYSGAAAHEDPDRLWFIFFYSEAGRQPINYSDSRMDDYLLGARDAMTFDERVESYHEAQRLNLEDPGFLILMTPYNFTAVDPRVRNWIPSASFGSVTRNSYEMWIDA